MSWLLVSVGGFLGANARYLVGVTFNKSEPLRPYGTWIANISGSILLGVLFVLLESGQINQLVFILLGTGFCGAYTTFSTFGTELLAMIVGSQWKQALLYIISSILISFTSVWIILYLFN
ncbi:putative fluoride ion transporter CrcB 2 [Paraliobacillus quinghaiensis]|uniref:Fluoride-specific ion channel FluC n=2 Tax=Paraliobacillus quinghaiensis TaxID=470815 RepID=A0A917WVF1_9BACI|nr:putative fluoride ion transporter CrcB 2 [Paraliobacillus quinghaiensis]